MIDLLLVLLAYVKTFAPSKYARVEEQFHLKALSYVPSSPRHKTTRTGGRSGSKSSSRKRKASKKGKRVSFTAKGKRVSFIAH
jgi:hypothetical protein